MHTAPKTSLFVFGLGHIAKALLAQTPKEIIIMATAREPSKRDAINAMGHEAIDPLDHLALKASVDRATHILISTAPDEDGCPAFRALGPYLSENTKIKSIIYLSTTGVYGDHGGGWVFEETRPHPTSIEGQRRLEAETQWRTLNAHHLTIFRLPGLYGPTRNPVEKLRSGTQRAIHKEGHVFSRLHEDDAARAIAITINAFDQGQTDALFAIYNLCDDEPASSATVLAWAAKTFCLDPAPIIEFDAASMSPQTLRFYADNKRVSNAKAKAVLGWRPLYPSYREGLKALMQKAPHEHPKP